MIVDTLPITDIVVCHIDVAAPICILHNMGLKSPAILFFLMIDEGISLE